MVTDYNAAMCCAFFRARPSFFTRRNYRLEYVQNEIRACVYTSIDYSESLGSIPPYPSTFCVCLYKACVRKAQVITVRDGTNGNCWSHTAQPPTTRPVSSDAAACRVSPTLVQYYIWVLITILAELNLFYSVLI